MFNLTARTSRVLAGLATTAVVVGFGFLGADDVAAHRTLATSVPAFFLPRSTDAQPQVTRSVVASTSDLASCATDRGYVVSNAIMWTDAHDGSRSSETDCIRIRPLSYSLTPASAAATSSPSVAALTIPLAAARCDNPTPYAHDVSRWKAEVAYGFSLVLRPFGGSRLPCFRAADVHSATSFITLRTTRESFARLADGYGAGLRPVGVAGDALACLDMRGRAATVWLASTSSPRDGQCFIVKKGGDFGTVYFHLVGRSRAEAKQAAVSMR